MTLEIDDIRMLNSGVSVNFRGRDEGGQVRFRISIEALQDHFDGIADPLAAFDEARWAIEAKAEELYAAGRFEPGEPVRTVLIRTADFVESGA